MLVVPLSQSGSFKPATFRVFRLNGKKCHIVTCAVSIYARGHSHEDGLFWLDVPTSGISLQIVSCGVKPRLSA